VAPAYQAGTGAAFRYTSGDSVLTRDLLHEHLTRLGVIDWPLEQFQGLKIEEIATNRRN